MKAFQPTQVTFIDGNGNEEEGDDLGGLTEATETLACFALMCLWPQHFAVLALGFAALCALTTVTRLWAGWTLLR
jgi:hypothetical protein